jgi:hypothetical protein
MAHEVELSLLDLRYESYRMKNPAQEGRLLASIVQRGIEEPFAGVQADPPILLNGFKRYRCARRLKIHSVPYTSLGQEEVAAIINLLGLANHKALGILEQARFLQELKEVRRMTLAELAAELSRSKAWVSVRLSLMSEMSPVVREKLFSGAFPVYAYMSTLRPFMRMNGVAPGQMDQFVAALSGHQLSVREIAQLAHGYFRGPESFRQQILSGHLALPLERLRQVPDDPDGSEFERVLLHDLELTQKYMQRVMGKSQDRRLESRGFFAQCHLLTAGILSRSPAFFQTLRTLHDRSGQA